MSPEDLQLILGGYTLPSGEKVRILKAAIVLCPDISLLAIPTAQTPFVELDDIPGFIAPYIQKKDKQLDKAERYKNLTQDITRRFYENMLDSQMAALVALETKQKNGDVTKEEFELQAKALIETFEEPEAAFREKLDNTAVRIKSKLTIQMQSLLL